MKKGAPGQNQLERKAGSLMAGSITENESFNRHYNKELKVSEGKAILNCLC